MNYNIKGYKVCSVSKNMTFPPWYPEELGICVVTHKVCESWVLPVLNSPKTSVIAMDSIPPASSLLKIKWPEVGS